MEAILLSFQKNRKWLVPLAKVSVAVLILLGLYYQMVRANNAATTFNEFLSHFSSRRASYLCLAVGLMPFNLAFETLKWLQFTRSFTNMKFAEAYRAVLAGMALAIFTPNRIGEYGGRLLFLPNALRARGAVAMLLGSYAQLFVLFFGGFFGFCWFAHNYLDWQAYIIRILILAGGLTCLFFLVGYLQIGRILPIIRKCGVKEAWLQHFGVLQSTSKNARFRALQWAALRYITYSTQYWLLLQFFGIEVPVLAAFAGIATIFLIQTGVPLGAGVALVARGEIALYVWGYFGANDISVLAATFLLFIINLALPALLGAIVLFTYKNKK